MAQYSNAHKKFEQIILRTDQVLLDKASKVSIVELRQEMKVNYSLISKVDDVDYELTERMLKIEDQQDQIVNNLQKMEDRLQLELKAAVRRMAIKAHNAGGGGGLLSRPKAQQQEQKQEQEMKKNVLGSQVSVETAQIANNESSGEIEGIK